MATAARKVYNKQYYEDHREEIVARNSKYQKEHREAFRDYQRQWERENKDSRSEERHLETCAERRARYLIENPTLFMKRRLFSFAKCRAKKFGIPFDISIDDFEIPEFCPVLGIKLSVEIGKRTDAAPSLDKVIPELGYVKGNVQVISWRANRLKGDATLAELESLVGYLKKNNT